MRRGFRIDTLQWFVGIFVALRGALMLMVPHQLTSQAFVPIHSYFFWLGAWQVVAGVTMIAAVTLIPRRTVIVLAHLLVGVALLQAAWGHWLSSTWTALADFSILGVGMAIAPFLPRQQPQSKGGIDLFALLMGWRLVLDSLIILGLSSPQFNSALYDPIRAYLPLYGLVYLAGGLALIVAYSYPRIPNAFFWAAHLLAGGVLLSWTATLGFPTWSSVLFFGGFGILTALLPWLGPRLRRIDPRSLKVQLVVTLVGLVTLPLLSGVALVTFPQEQATINQVLALQQTLATALSQDVASYIRLHVAAVDALARQPNLSEMSALEQQNLLQLLNQSYPDIVAFTTYDADGNAIARSDNRPLSPPLSDLELYQTVQRVSRPVLEIRVGRVIEQPVFVFAAPLYNDDQQFAGVAMGAIASMQVTEQLVRTGASANLKIYLVDEQGRIIAHIDSTLVDSFTSYAEVPPVAKLLEQESTDGGIQYWENNEWQLAGYARVPDLEWGVVVERPAAEVLESINTRRNRDFEVLIVVAVIAFVISLLVARKLTEPLTVLANASRQLAIGNAKAPLPQSGITEVAYLSGVFGTMRDRLLQRTAERDHAEQEQERLLKRERLAREEAEAANRIKDEFLAVLSHELRSPLNPILGWARLLRSRTFDAAATDRALETIERNAKMQTQLIDDLLDVARILRGKVVLEVRPVDLVGPIEAAVETVRLAADAKSIQLQMHLANDAGLVAGDTGRLQQVVWNLLSNAVKFTPVGGQVQISLSQVDSQAQIAVTDTGRGVSPEFLPYLFDYFRQADSSTTRKFGGLGLGLAIVRHIVELHGGTIEATSLGEGQGATFRVRLPLLADQTQKGNPKAATFPIFNSSSLAGIRVLVVDDEPDTRDLLLAILQQAGAEATMVGSAAEVLQTLQQLKFDLLISDIGMPEMDGYMLLRQIRRSSTEQAKIPAIALTAYAGEFNQQKVLAAGFQKHLAKPIEPDELIEAIVSLVQEGDR